MSIESMAHVLNLKVGDSTRKLVLVGIANHASKDGTAAFRSVSAYADYADCSVRTAQRHIGRLLEDGFIREGDQRLVDHLPPHSRPIVYDVAMTPEQQEAWKAERGSSRRTTAAAIGATGGQKAAQNRRGDNLTPGGGDNLTPGSDPEGGDTGDTGGVTPVTPGGDTGVTQTVLEPPLEPSKDGAPLRDTPDDGALPGLAAEKDALAPDAGTLVRAFQAKYEEVTGAPITKDRKQRGYHALVRSFVTPAFASGATVDEVKHALWAAAQECSSPWPNANVLERELARARGGRPLERPGRGRTGAYRDSQWQHTQPDAPLSDAELDAKFGLPRAANGG